MESIYFNIEVELYEERDGRKFVFLANDGSSGCKYEYRDKEELKSIINDYVADVIDYMEEEE